MFDEIIDERVLELSYKRICEFEKAHYESIHSYDNGSINMTIDKDLYLQFLNDENVSNDFLSPVTYPSYKDMFNKRYRNNFKRNLTAINHNVLENEIGKDNINNVVNEDKELIYIYKRLTKERDLDNDGVPDRIDINDTRNNIQTTKDLDAVKNSTSASTERYNEKKEQQQKNKRRENELEL